MRISVQIEEVLPLIIRHIREKYGLRQDIDLEYSSNTTFLTFDSKGRVLLGFNIWRTKHRNILKRISEEEQ